MRVSAENIDPSPHPRQHRILLDVAAAEIAAQAAFDCIGEQPGDEAGEIGRLLHGGFEMPDEPRKVRSVQKQKP